MAKKEEENNQEFQVDLELEIGEDDQYETFSKSRKRFLVFIVAISCFLSPASGMAFLPSVPEISTTFNTTPTIINISNAVYCVVMAIAPCLVSPLVGIYGRRIVFLLCAMLFSISTILVAVSQNLSMFFVFRALSAMFGTPFLSVGATIISDLFPPTERGRALSWTLASAQIGPAFSPILGGIFVTYCSWRATFYFLFAVGIALFILSLLFLSETGRSIPYVEFRENTGKWLYLKPYNPFKVIIILRNQNLILAGFISSAIAYNMYGLLTPIRHVINPRFGLNSPILGSLFYLAPGTGYILGSLIGGRWADYWVKKYIKLRGVRIPEDRLRSMDFFLGLFLPISMLGYGWSLQKEVGGMVLPIVFMFISGTAQTLCFPSVNAYCTEALPEFSNEGIASNYMIRYVAAAVASATILKQIDSIGIGMTCTISAIVLWIGELCLIVLINYGPKLRKS